MFTVSMDDLHKVFKDFYNLTKFMIVLYSADRKVLFRYPGNMCTFCKTVRSNNNLLKKCLDCDNKGFDKCDETRAPYIYECHMSLIEAIAPIYSNEMNIGYLMFGQIITNNKGKVIETAKKISDLYQIKITNEMISEMTVADGEYISSAVNMMTMCANYLYTNEIIRNNPDILSYQLKEYIKFNLDSDLSVSNLCKQFYISQTKLYKLSKSTFKMGISDYVRIERITKAKKLLSGTTLPVSRIGETVGINDTNYFIRMFKNAEGITPLQYRKKYYSEN
ncbi:MAG: PocR ligand-binding domain-containing protein [Clostridia bacterium]|nr:PocR ligand-binding domain-containing protein [Clostridia bacterium]